jgi:hypothetical protein
MKRSIVVKTICRNISMDLKKGGFFWTLLGAIHIFLPRDYRNLYYPGSQFKIPG